MCKKEDSTCLKERHLSREAPARHSKQQISMSAFALFSIFYGNKKKICTRGVGDFGPLPTTRPAKTSEL